MKQTILKLLLVMAIGILPSCTKKKTTLELKAHEMNLQIDEYSSTYTSYGYAVLFIEVNPYKVNAKWEVRNSGIIKLKDPSNYSCWVDAVGVGTTYIIVSTDNGVKIDSCKVSVTKIVHTSTVSGGGGGGGSGCSSVQCSGTTQQGNRCKNITTNCSGRCYLH